MKRLILTALLCGAILSARSQAPMVSGIYEKDLCAYLFVYFTGNSGEQESLRYAISNDGYHFHALNGNRPVLNSKEISSTGGIRDPHILRCEDGKTFYMVMTDMVSALGWSSNRAMVLLKSTDLIHWEHTVINIQKKYQGQENLLRVWAPQTIYDKEAGKYMIYWSMKHGDAPDIIYYAYANKAFNDLEGEPKPLFLPANGRSCIDADIVYKDGEYHMFYKTEGHGNGIKKATTKSLSSGQWTEQAEYKQQTKDPVEGSGVFKRNQSDSYVLMYDVYTKGRYQFTESTDLDTFRVIDNEISMDFHPRHGTVLPITRSELKRLTTRYGMPEAYSLPTACNPVLEGMYADPEVLYAQKTGKYYIYPTSDGFDGWGGYYFKVFSSDNLKDWTDEGCMLDLKKDVSWADRNAWAPCIIEKKIKRGEYRYYYYFTAAQKVGVAVADHPTGPFVDSGKPVIDFKPEGINRGQEIDPDVFQDPRTGKYYLYWGNGYMAVAELEKDMLGIKKESMRVLKVDRTYREGTYVFYRKGLYYFLWSENDTRDADYRVRYGTSKSPLGPIEIPQQNLVIAKDASKGIYGTGHCSVLQIPGKDEWYLVYHRFNRPYGIQMGAAAGFNREVCIDKLTFDDQGTILQLAPTL